MSRKTRIRGATAALLAAGSLGGLASATTAQAAVVPNMFVRECSNITRRCTGYWQTNGHYNPSVPSTWSTRWVWRWI